MPTYVCTVHVVYVHVQYMCILHMYCQCVDAVHICNPRNVYSTYVRTLCTFQYVCMYSTQVCMCYLHVHTTYRYVLSDTNVYFVSMLCNIYTVMCIVHTVCTQFVYGVYMDTCIG